jgi:hypothetical protein
MSVNTRSNILAEIREELDYQATLWGTDFDDKNTPNDWVTFICRYAVQTAREHAAIPSERRSQLIKVAALAVAAIEAQERVGVVPRHYD